ncbi:MAG: hypothetical protein PHW33_04800 [Candidatus Portnoybacteria bacterium]|nr:hypothetical protein [Candidatus Portnoybacteria bacterium]
MKPLYTKKELIKLLKEKQRDLETINIHTLVCSINLDEFDHHWQIAMHVAFPNSSPPKEELDYYIDRVFEIHLTIECLEHDFEVCSEQLKTLESLLKGITYNEHVTKIRNKK